MPRIWLIGAAAFVGVLLIASIVIGLTQRTQEFPEGSPERTVQLLLQAADEDDFVAAHGLLAANLRSDCAIEDFAGGRFGGKSDLGSSRVTLQDTKPLNGSVVVTANVTQVRSSGPFGTSEWSHEERFTLSDDEGGWRFVKYPWPFLDCSAPVLRSDSPPASRTAPEGLPEGSVQRFLAALEGEDSALAYSFLSEELKTACGFEEFSTAAPDVARAVGDSRVTFETTTFVERTALVQARVIRLDASHQQEFILREETDEWRFSEYPWPYHDCGRHVFAPDEP